MIFNPTVQGGKQEAPVISVSSSGLITATAGDQSATQQLPTQAARTITPSTSRQTAVASGRYTTGNVTVAGSANLVPANIKSGVNIFGVTGILSGMETATGTFSSNAFLVSIILAYSDGNQIQSREEYNPISFNINVLKGSMLLITSGNDLRYSGGVQLVDTKFNLAPDYYFFLVTGDFTMQY